MKKISGQLISSKPISLDRAAVIVTGFASIDNGSSATLSLYLQRTADAFSDLLQFHTKRSADAEHGPRRKKVRRSESDDVSKNPVEETAKGLEIRGERDANPNEDEKKKKKKKKKKKTKRGGDEDLDL